MGLQNIHKDAVLQSGGISDENIYQIFKNVIQEYNAEGRLLDYGAGKGRLLEHLYKMNRFKSLSGIDLYDKSANIPASIDWKMQDLNGVTSYSSDSFDVIVSAEVIEHLENPRAIAREWNRILAPNGLLIFSTPNNESIRSILSLLFKGHYIYFLDSSYPAHITSILEMDAKRIVKEAGFSDISIRYSNRGGIPKIPRFSWQNISFGILKGKRFSDNMLVVAKKL